MNWLKRCNGQALVYGKTLMQAPLLRGARLDARATGRAPTKLVIGIGQIHPVLHGRFEGFQARRIARVQGWIFGLCSWMTRVLGVHTFGQEGLSTPGAGLFRMRWNEATLGQMRLQLRDSPTDFFQDVAARWRAALRRGNAPDTAEYNMLLNALLLHQAMDPSITVFPIEQMDVHGRLGAGLSVLQQQIDAIEATPTYRQVLAKNGENLTRGEYEVAMMRARLVQSANAVLTHPERDRSILREVLKHAEHQELTVFVLGQGHREAMLTLAKEFLPADTMFLWITPPMLRARVNLLRALGAIILIAILLGGLWWARFAG